MDQVDNKGKRGNDIKFLRPDSTIQPATLKSAQSFLSRRHTRSEGIEHSTKPTQGTILMHGFAAFSGPPGACP
jgi:hypothetical protein